MQHNLNLIIEFFGKLRNNYEKDKLLLLDIINCDYFRYTSNETPFNPSFSNNRDNGNYQNLIV